MAGVSLTLGRATPYHTDMCRVRCPCNLTWPCITLRWCSTLPTRAPGLLQGLGITHSLQWCLQRKSFGSGCVHREQIFFFFFFFLLKSTSQYSDLPAARDI